MMLYHLSGLTFNDGPLFLSDDSEKFILNYSSKFCPLIVLFSRPPVIRVSDKVMIPQEEHPEINFVGLLIGPRGNTLKSKVFQNNSKICLLNRICFL